MSVSKCLYNAIMSEIKRNGEKITENEKHIRALNLQIVFKICFRVYLKNTLKQVVG